MGSMKLPLLKAVGGAATQYSHGMGHRPSPGRINMPARGILCRGAVLQPPMVDPPVANMAATWEPEGRKQGPLQTQHMNQWKAQLWKRKPPVEDPLHSWHVPEGIWDWGRYCFSIVVMPTEPLVVSLRINCGGRTTSCWPNIVWPTEVRAIITVVVLSDDLQQMTVRGGVLVDMVTVTWDIMRNTI